MTLIRKARAGDIPSIAGIINGMAVENVLLPLTQEQIILFLRDFFVAEGESGEFEGCCALHLYSRELAEIRSLVVIPEHQRRGIGKQLTKQCIQECRTLGIHRIFALTRKIAFFQKLGFTIVAKDSLPEKVYKDCSICPKMEHCDETALIRDVSLNGGEPQSQ